MRCVRLRKAMLLASLASVLAMRRARSSPGLRVGRKPNKENSHGPNPACRRRTQEVLKGRLKSIKTMEIKEATAGVLATSAADGSWYSASTAKPTLLAVRQALFSGQLPSLAFL